MKARAVPAPVVRAGAAFPRLAEVFGDYPSLASFHKTKSRQVEIPVGIAVAAPFLLLFFYYSITFS
jgi:hypothetical protein